MTSTKLSSGDKMVQHSSIGRAHRSADSSPRPNTHKEDDETQAFHLPSESTGTIQSTWMSSVAGSLVRQERSLREAIHYFQRAAKIQPKKSNGAHGYVLLPPHGIYQKALSYTRRFTAMSRRTLSACGISLPFARILE